MSKERGSGKGAQSPRVSAVVPRLRFGAFKWSIKKASQICDVRDGTHDSPKYCNNGVPLITSKNIINGRISLNDIKYISEIDAEKINRRSKVDKNDILLSMIGTVGEVALITKTPFFCIKNIALFKPMLEIRPKFLVYYFQSPIFRKNIKKKFGGGIQKFLSLGALRNLNVPVPHFSEQKKIADCLSSLDELIKAQKQKVEGLKEHKKGLLQQLFPQEGEVVPRLRFPEFESGWGALELCKCLEYEQPTPYLVKDTNYNKNYSIPVLTAGKSFILGYTNEDFGIFDKNLPVLIFDDFTTATKFVDFSFKVKSSALKILKSKDGFDIRFMYGVLQTLKYQVGAHQRHWISKFSLMKIKAPSYVEQKKKSQTVSLPSTNSSGLKSKKSRGLRNTKRAYCNSFFPQI